MDLIYNIKKIFLEAKGFTKSKNYYFEMHNCNIKNDVVKINMYYTIKNDNYDDIYIVKLGICPYCKEVFYCEDFNDKII